MSCNGHTGHVMKGDDELVGNEAAAAYVGLSPSTWRPYVNRKQAPAPHRREVRGGHALPVWRKTDLDQWMATRPGRGARTDLADPS